MDVRRRVTIVKLFGYNSYPSYIIWLPYLHHANLFVNCIILNYRRHAIRRERERERGIVSVVIYG